MNNRSVLFILFWLLSGCEIAPLVIDAYGDSYTQYEYLEAIANNVCEYEKVYQESSEQDRSARLSFLLAQKSNYNQVAAKYDAAVRNALDRKYLKPADLPSLAPKLEEMKNEVCNLQG